LIVFSSDQTGKDPAFVDFAGNADLLIMHMAIPEAADSAALNLHATPEAIGKVARASGAKKLVLSHFMARSLRRLGDNVNVVKSNYAGPVIVAQDLSCIAVNPG
jgi:ribonuclease BN (tRNA processing enzyme)